MEKSWYFLIVIIFLWACSSDSSSDSPSTDDDVSVTDDTVDITFDRGAMLTNWADNIIMPSYEGFLTAFSEFKTTFETFKATRNAENLTALRASWLTAYKGWQHIAMYEIGPAEENDLRLNINTYPTDNALLESYITSGTYDFALPSNRDVKGFPALDYLINGLGENDEQIIAIYNSETTDIAYLNYLEDVIEDIETRVSAVTAAWNDGYRNTFVANDGSSATATADRFVNDFIFYYEKFLRAGKMGIPLGVFTGTTAPNTIEALYSDGVSNALFLEGLDAVQNFFNGKYFNSAATGESLASYLQDLNTLKEGVALDQMINSQINTARDSITALDDFKTEIETNDPPTDMFRAYDEVQAVVPLLKVDMVSAMSISIDFVDADGD